MASFVAPAMFFILLLLFAAVGFSAAAADFTNDGFRPADLSLDGISELGSDGMLLLSNGTANNAGHAFHPDPISFKNSSAGEAFSFSTHFVFAIRSVVSEVSAEGLAFVISPTKSLPGGRNMGNLGLYEINNTTSHVVAVELDTFQNPGSIDLDNNHLGVDIGKIDSVKQATAGYYSDEGAFRNLTLMSGDPMQVWVDYDGRKKVINVTMAPIDSKKKPGIPLISQNADLSTILEEKMYVGFSAATGPFSVKFFVLGWSFAANGAAARQLNLSQLPKLPKIGGEKTSQWYTIGIPFISVILISAFIVGLLLYLKTQRKYTELVEDWEVAYGPHRFKYRDLYKATKGFRETELLGAGGFGRVYKGEVGSPSLDVAVKRIAHDSKQGIREFVSEIVSIGRMSHRNLVPLLGYCRRKGELMLIYQFMPNGSLDRLLFSTPKFTLTWVHRFRIINGVASGLFYLHEEWDQVVIHRDVKSSNVLLDAEFNARLGDFGLARLQERGSDPQTTKVVGTVGYLAPEYYRSGRATTSTDVYAFGIFLFEVATGKKPVVPQSTGEDAVLVEWVISCWEEGRLVETVDPRLGNEFVKDEVELVLKLGLLCTHPEANCRPTMQKVMLYLNGSLLLSELAFSGVSGNSLADAYYGKGFEDVSMNKMESSSTGRATSSPMSFVADSLLSGGR